MSVLSWIIIAGLGLALVLWIKSKAANSSSMVVTGPGVLKTHDVEAKFRKDGRYLGKLAQSRWSDGQERFSLRLRGLTADHDGKLRLFRNADQVSEFDISGSAINFGWKGGIGTSSRKLPEQLGGYTLGVLVQTNYGGVLQMDGLPVGKELGQYYLSNAVDKGDADGSIILVVATDAPLSDRNLTRLANRALMAIARTGSPATNGSGDYAVAFSTAPSVRRTAQRRNSVSKLSELPNNLVSPLFEAAMEASEEAIYNALLAAVTTVGYKGTIEALPLDRLTEIIGQSAHHKTGSD